MVIGVRCWCWWWWWCGVGADCKLSDFLVRSDEEGNFPGRQYRIRTVVGRAQVRSGVESSIRELRPGSRRRKCARRRTDLRRDGGRVCGGV
ncbi:hypothetical protein BJX70DRAFT_282927 [Aspergillus crustosus]